MVTTENGIKRRSIDASIGFTKQNERVLSVKVVDDSDPLLTTIGNYMQMLSEQLADISVLKDQEFSEEKVKQQTQKRIENVVQRSKRQQGANIISYAVNQDVKKKILKEFLNEFVGEQGLTVKPEGKAIIKCASSQLSVLIKLFNEKDERIVTIINEVTFLGGDKEGKKYKDFVDKLSTKLATTGLLKNCLYQPNLNPYFKKTPSAVFRELKEPEPKEPPHHKHEIETSKHEIETSKHETETSKHEIETHKQIETQKHETETHKHEIETQKHEIETSKQISNPNQQNPSTPSPTSNSNSDSNEPNPSQQSNS